MGSTRCSEFKSIVGNTRRLWAQGEGKDMQWNTVTKVLDKIVRQKWARNLKTFKMREKGTESIRQTELKRG